MKRQNTERIDVVIRQFLQQNGLEKPFLEHKLIEKWPQIMGPLVQKYTGKINIKDGTLYVHITSAALRQELFIARHELIQKLNNEMNAQVISDIRLLG